MAPTVPVTSVTKEMAVSPLVGGYFLERLRILIS